MTKGRDVSCRVVRQRLYDYLDGELDANPSKAIRAHLETCDGCAQHADFENHVLVGLKHQLRQTAAPPALIARVRAILGSEPPPFGAG